MGGGFGRDGSVRWKISSGKPSEQSSQDPNDKEEITYQAGVVKKAMGFDGDSQRAFTLYVKAPEQALENLKKLLNDLKPGEELRWQVPADGTGDQVRIRWDERPDTAPQGPVSRA